MSGFEFALENWPLVAAFLGLIVAYFVVNSVAGGKSISVHEVTRLVNQGNAFCWIFVRPVSTRLGISPMRLIFPLRRSQAE